MNVDFEVIDQQPTGIGELVLRRRRDLQLAGRELWEVKLGDEFLMSSLFTEGEVALARLGLAECGGGPLEVVVGGLGLGYTAHAALDDPRVAALVVIDALGPVIEWHRKALVPLGAGISGDTRCRLVLGNFFALAAPGGDGFDAESPERRFDAVLLDVDHSPRHLLDEANAPFYTEDGQRAFARLLCPGGIFALWSNDPPDDAFVDTLNAVYAQTRAEVVSFDNPYTGGASENTIYLARTAGAA